MSAQSSMSGGVQRCSPVLVLDHFIYCHFGTLQNVLHRWSTTVGHHRLPMHVCAPPVQSPRLGYSCSCSRYTSKPSKCFHHCNSNNSSSSSRTLLTRRMLPISAQRINTCKSTTCWLSSVIRRHTILAVIRGCHRLGAWVANTALGGTTTPD